MTHIYLYTFHDAMWLTSKQFKFSWPKTERAPKRVCQKIVPHATYVSRASLRYGPLAYCTLRVHDLDRPTCWTDLETSRLITRDWTSNSPKKESGILVFRSGMTRQTFLPHIIRSSFIFFGNLSCFTTPSSTTMAVVEADKQVSYNPNQQQ